MISQVDDEDGDWRTFGFGEQGVAIGWNRWGTRKTPCCCMRSSGIANYLNKWVKYVFLMFGYDEDSGWRTFGEQRVVIGSNRWGTRKTPCCWLHLSSNVLQSVRWPFPRYNDCII